MNSTDLWNNISQRLDQLETKINKMAAQIEAIYNDDPPAGSGFVGDELPAVERIKKYGQRIPYNLLDDPNEMARFKTFLFDAKRNGRSFLTDTERELLDIADKNFDDIRLSSKHLSVLRSINQKLFRRDWPFRFKQGYMYKLEGYAPEWEFFS